MELTEEQRRRIEENKAAALAKLSGTKRQHIETVVATQPEAVQAKAAISNGRKQKPTSPTINQIKSRLESSGMVSVIDGKDAILFKGLAGTYYKDSAWHLPLSSYQELLTRTKISDGVPENIVSTLYNQQQSLSKDEVFNLSFLPQELSSCLFPFQLDGVQWGLNKNGRFILADDMGLGKSIQALAIAAYYRQEWPLLILSPASMVATWTEQVKRWLSPSSENWASIDEQRMSVAYDGKTSLNGLVNIVSYDLAVRLIDNVKALKAGVIISDESHCLRNNNTKRFKTLSPVLRKTGRLILLSGTPALSRPIELFSQLSLISPQLFPRQVDYGLRYCAGRKDRFGWNFRGASNLKELSIILEETVMLRRSKSQVMSQLPRKIRQQVFVRIPTKEMKELKLLADSISANEWASLNGLEEAQRKGELMALWRKTGEAKLLPMWAYVMDLLDTEDDSYGDSNESDERAARTGRKILIFAHHQSLLEALEAKSIENGIGYIRIDGKTPPSSRHSLCTRFQTDPKVRIAILSITAASVGLTLTAATLVVFFELFFNPGILIQAEDRAHRIGQTDSVTVHYLLAKGTIDDRLWPLLLSKLNTLESVGLGQNEFTGMIQVDHDERQLKMDRFLTS